MATSTIFYKLTDPRPDFCQLCSPSCLYAVCCSKAKRTHLQEEDLETNEYLSFKCNSNISRCLSPFTHDSTRDIRGWFCLIISYLPSHLSTRNPFHCIKRLSLLWKQLFHIFIQFTFHKTGGMWLLHSNIILSYPEQRHPFMSIWVLPQKLHDSSVQKACY